MKKIFILFHLMFLSCLIICLSAQALLYFPHIASDRYWGTEICTINTGAGSVTGTLKAYDNYGDSVADDIEITMGPHGRKEITVGNEFSNPSDIGYIVFDTGSPDVCGYTKFYTEGKYRVAVPAVSDISAGDLFIPHIASTDKWWTGISIVNTTDSPKTLTIDFDFGTTRNISLAGKEHKAFNIKSLFGNTPQPNLCSAVIKNADGIIGLELFGNGNQLSGILLKNDTTQHMYYPHIASNRKWWTGIVAYNPSASSCTLAIKPYSASGTALATQRVTVSGMRKYIGSIKDLGLPAESAWFQIDATEAITGFELFGTSNGKLLAGYTGVNINGKQGVFAKEERSGWTGIAFININNSSADVDLKAYDDSGELIATESMPLEPYEKIVNNPEHIFSRNIDNSTYIAYSSDKDLVGFQLNGSSDGMMLDGLPGLRGLDPNAPASLSIEITPDMILADDIDGADINVNIAPYDEINGDIEDGTEVNFKIDSGYANLNSNTEFSINNKASTSLTAYKEGIVIVEASVAGTNISGSAQVQVVSSFNSMFTKSSFGSVVNIMGYYQAGSTLGLTITNKSNRKFDLTKFEVKNGSESIATSTDETLLSDGTLEAYESVSLQITFSQDIEGKGISLIYYLTDQNTGRNFTVQNTNQTPPPLFSSL